MEEEGERIKSITKSIIEQMKAGDITAVQAGIELDENCIPLPATLSKMINAELRLVEAPEEEIKPAPPKEAAISMQQYAEFVEWQKQKAQEKAATLIAKIEAEDKEFNDGEA